MLRVFGHGLCAWRYSIASSESLVCTLDAPDRRSPAFYPFEIQSPNGNALAWLKDAFRESQQQRFSRNGADRSRGSNGECRNSQPNGLPHSWLMLRPPRSSSAPGTPLRYQFVAALKGAAGFRSRRGSPRPAAPLGGGGAVSTSFGGRFRGARFLGRAVGPFRTGDRAPESAVCGGWRRSRMACGWLAGRPDSGAKMDSQFSMRVQVKCACVRPDRGSLTSHQDRTTSTMFSTCPPSTVHLQSTLNYL